MASNYRCPCNRSVRRTEGCRVALPEHRAVWIGRTHDYSSACLLRAEMTRNSVTVHVENSDWHALKVYRTTLRGRGLAPIALLTSRSRNPCLGLSGAALSRVSMRGNLLVEASAAQTASLRHEDYVIDELLLELHLGVQSGFHVLESFLDTFSLEIPSDDSRIRHAIGAAKLF